MIEYNIVSPLNATIYIFKWSSEWSELKFLASRITIGRFFSLIIIGNIRVQIYLRERHACRSWRAGL